MSIKEMEEVWSASISEDEREGNDVNLGVEGTNSNGHRKEIDKERRMTKLIEKLQKDAQARQADSQKLMKIRDRQGEFNLKNVEEPRKNRKEIGKRE